MAKKPAPNTAAVEACVLVACLIEGEWVNPYDVVSLAPELVEGYAPMIDTAAEAVAYAKSLVTAPAVEAAPAEPAPIEAAPEPVAA